MIIEIDRETKVELLKALQDGQIDTKRVPELFNRIKSCREFQQTMIIWNETKIYKKNDTDN